MVSPFSAVHTDSFPIFRYLHLQFAVDNILIINIKTVYVTGRTMLTSDSKDPSCIYMNELSLHDTHVRVYCQQALCAGCSKNQLTTLKIDHAKIRKGRNT